MLCELKISNLALIERLHLDLCENDKNGLVVMTGETGAGKSIMLRAIHLLTGGRGSAEWIRSGEDNCVVEALFEISPENRLLHAILETQGLEVEDALIMKRVVNRNGRSRMYINGSPATAKMASELAMNLLNVASQHDHQQLLQPYFHLDFLDTLGKIWPQRKAFDTLFLHWQERRNALEQLQQQEREKEQRKDFLQYQLQEIRELAPVPGEDEELIEERKRLKSAESLIQISRKSHTLLANSLLDGLTQIRMDMAQVAEIDHSAEELAAELAGFGYQAEDLVNKLREYRDSLVDDPYRLEIVNERLNELQGLKRKYGNSLADILCYAEEAEAELKHIENLDKEVAECEAEVLQLESNLCSQAVLLSERRKETAEKLEKAMARELGSLAFHQAVLEVRFGEHGADAVSLRQGGWDRVEFFFSANPGEPLRPLAKVASGGELSRLMLAFKCLLAQKDMVETVIFDEVDAGIGGEAAEAVARKIQELAGHHQVFCITHLPQIAARGTTHFLVEKGVEEGRTQSSIKLLDPDQRLDEMSRMLAGESVSEQTRAWAEELFGKGKSYNMKQVTALALFSGGLDSILAARLVASLGVKVLAVKFVTPFFDYELLADPEQYQQEVMEKYGLEVVLYDLSHNYLDLLHKPAHGFGKNFNPCIDCKILMCSRARELMAKYDASFLISGEVLGQRPMSQRRDTLRVIERDSDNDGLLLRPLSAKLMPPTKPEKEGWIDREKLLNFNGRGRSRQIELAKQYGITDFPAPAGGCILADPILSRRIARIYRGDFVIKAEAITVTDVRLLLVGRQFLLPGGFWLIVGRNEKENRKIEELAGENGTLLYMPDRPGPTALLRGGKDECRDSDVMNEVICKGAGLVVRYGKRIKGDDLQAEVVIAAQGEERKIISLPLEDEIFNGWIL